MAEQKVNGLLELGNIDLYSRPEVKNPDGSTSTVRSISVNMNGREYLIPTVIGNRIVPNDEAIKHFRKTGQHLGVFDSPASATAYANQLHNDYASGKYKARPMTREELVRLIRLSNVSP
jgi:hypothetical protein